MRTTTPRGWFELRLRDKNHLTALFTRHANQTRSSHIDGKITQSYALKTLVNQCGMTMVQARNFLQ